MQHIPVLFKEAMHYLNIHPEGIYVDCTLGGGSHAKAVLSKLTSGFLYAFDQDPFALEKARPKLASVSDRFEIIASNFKHIKRELHNRDIKHIDGVLYDLGVSSFHFDDPSRGFSYHHDAVLDMRMDPSQSLDAYTIVNTYEPNQLRHILKQYGEETFADRIVGNIVTARDKAPIKTTHELVDIIKASLPQKVLRKKGHPAKQTFQAIRIAVNDELNAFKASLNDSLSMLKPNGRIVVISFHSLEDKIAKQCFKEAARVDHPDILVTMPETSPDYHIITKKVVRPSEEEMLTNPRAKSAKLRALEKAAKK